MIRTRRDARRAARALLVAAAAAASFAAQPAPAAPHDARIDGVFLARDCSSDVCRPGSDEELREGAVVRGVLQVHVSAEADLGLEWVRLEAHFKGDPRWYCLESWDADRATEFSAHRTWNTVQWTDPRRECTPESCSSCSENSPHKHGELSQNLPHDLRVRAHEQGSIVSDSEDDTSASFTVELANAPRAPEWVTQPAVGGGARPSVTLQWRPNPEADIAEYHFVRDGPGGDEAEFAVSADRPSAQGCTAIGTSAIRCVDTDLPPAGGSVRYAVLAYRPAARGAHRCALSGDPCVQSELSAVRKVTVPGSARDGEDSGNGGDGGGEGGGDDDEAPDIPLSVSPPPARAGEIAAALRRAEEGGGGPGALPIALAVALVLGVGGLLGRRMLAERARQGS